MAQARGVELEKVLIREFGGFKQDLLEALAEYYHCASIEYDERLPIPPELLFAVSQDSLSSYQWMPVMKDRSGMVTIAARNPESPAMQEDVRKFIKAER